MTLQQKKEKYNELIALLAKTKALIEEINVDAYEIGKETEQVVSVGIHNTCDSAMNVDLHLMGYGSGFGTVDVFDLLKEKDHGTWIEKYNEVDGIKVFTMAAVRM